MGSQIVGLCLFLCSLVTKGSCSSQIFIQTDHNLHLHVPESHIEYITFYWKINTSSNIITQSRSDLFPNPEYKDRVEFFPQNLSLILKNVQLRDSGTYSAVASRAEGDKTLHFEVIVEDPVSPVELSLSSESNSSESCNFTVSCTTELDNISRSFTCDTHSCEEPRPQTPGHAPPLHLYLSNVSIICNHSNHISWTNATRDIQQVCPKPGSTPSYTPVWVIVIACAGVCVLIVAFPLYLRKRKSRRMNMAENTIYAEASPAQPAPNPRTDLEECPASLYSMVGPHNGPASPADSASVQNPESLYAKVDKPSRHQS